MKVVVFLIYFEFSLIKLTNTLIINVYLIGIIKSGYLN